MPWLEAGGNAICSTNGRSPGSFCWPIAAAPPTATHPTARTHETEFKKLSAVTFGLGSTDHEVPFQFSTKLCGWNPLPPPPPNEPNEPTAQHCTELRHVMLLRIAGVVELGTDDDMSVQPDPFQCSMRTPAG